MVETVKKIALSLSVVVLFALYSLQKQAQPLFSAITAGVPGSAASPSVIVPSPAAAAWNPSSDPPATFPVTNPTATPTPTDRSVAFFDGDATGSEVRPTTPPTPAAPVATSTAVATLARTVPTPTTPARGAYRDGTYDGGPADANWGEVEVQAVIAGGQLRNVRFQQYPNHRGRSVAINQQAMPILIQEAIQAQKADVDVVTGATDTSQAFIQSLGSALRQAAS
jgi:uncharacterized protein with FMN-binding domain